MKDLVFCLGAIILLVVAIAVPANLIGAYRCGNFEETTGYETKYHWFDICYVNYNDRWYRWDEYTARATASEGLGSISETIQGE